MKFNFNKHLYKGSILAVTFFAAACLPDSDSNSIDVGDAPEATFTVQPVSGKTNTFVVTASEPDVFSYKWNFGKAAGYQVGTSPDTIYYPFAGTYTITLRGASANGFGEFSKELVVEESDPEACKGDLMFLSGCDNGGTSKQWHLIPAAGALTVGPTDGGVWWSSGEGDVSDAGRTCLFNDIVTFYPAGKVDYDDTGDFRVDDEGGNPWPTDMGLGIGCHDMSAIPAKYHPWGSGSFAYELTEDKKLILIGTGAHLGLYKAGENGTTDKPETKITYEILELTADKLVVRKMYSWGYWKFVYVPVE